MAVIKDFKKPDGTWAKTKFIDGKRNVTKSYNTWRHMMERCTSGYATKKNPSYLDCTVSDSFKDFQQFTDWFTQQKGYGNDEYHLDKDFLIKGNRVYSETTCVLIPKRLNSFLVNHNKGKGVHWARNESKYVAQVSNNGKSVHIGYFDTEEDAVEAHKEAKSKLAKSWVNLLKLLNLDVDLRVIHRLENFNE